MAKDNFSVKGEVVFAADKKFKADPSEKKADQPRANETEFEKVQNSVFSEPSSTSESVERPFPAWFRDKIAETDFGQAMGATLVAGLVGGLWAVVCIFANQYSRSIAFIGYAYLVVIGPTLEELLKQSSNIYLLEKKPFLLKYRWQVPLIAFLSALGFAAIENILYTKFYFSPVQINNFDAFVAFRWTICTSLHCCCALIASLGLARCRRNMYRNFATANLPDSYPYFVIAIAVHGFYNAVAVTYLQRLFHDSCGASG